MPLKELRVLTGTHEAKRKHLVPPGMGEPFDSNQALSQEKSPQHCVSYQCIDK